MRAIGFFVTILGCILLTSGCGGDRDKKGVNLDKDKPVPQKEAEPGKPRG